MSSARCALKKVLKQAADMGLGMNLGIECEVFVVKLSPEGKLADEAVGKFLGDLGAALGLAIRQAKAAASVK